MITFLDAITDLIWNILSLELINGITLHVIFYYNLLLISFWFVFTRRS